MEPYEKLGAFYLGRSYDIDAGKITNELTLYDSRDLLTHAFCVGMTGSGKTGLCVTLIEEAAIDGIPALVIDPKGDLANLMLTFPDLRAEDFREWIDEQQAERQGVSPDEYARSQARLWRDGLESWGQTGERIARLRNSAEFTVFTPGSNAGVPVSILESLAAPPSAIRTDADLFNERVGTTATSLLNLLGVGADPLKSREHILLSKILDETWHGGSDMDLPGLIRAIEKPPFSRVGVLDLDTFMSADARFELAATFNNLLASPGFEAWRTGVPIDIDRMLYTPSGKPRISIFSIAHLSDNERMFFVSLLLNETLGWVRSRPGTTSLRAIVYMDEIFGFIPPVADPPAKRPLLTLLKQARAYGVGVVLATQNPVDLDYKALSNTGTWFVGRLQTDRDRARVLDGLEGASAGTKGGFDRARTARIIAGIRKRVFLMHNIHENDIGVFHTRWAMSYLRGPMTREQIKRITAPSRDSIIRSFGAAVAQPSTAVSTQTVVPPVERATSQPMLPPAIHQVFLPLLEPPGNGGLVYRPALIGIGRVRFGRTRLGTQFEEPYALLAPLHERMATVDWRTAARVDFVEDDLDKRPAPDAGFGPLPPKANAPRSYAGWRRSLADALYRSERIALFKSRRLKLVSEPGESERDFRIRLAGAARENRDYIVERLRKKYASKFRAVEERIRRSELAVEREKDQAGHQNIQTAISFGATLLSAFLGRKGIGRSTLGRATTAARGIGRSTKEAGDVERARSRLRQLKSQLEELHAEFNREIERLEVNLAPELEELEKVTLTPRKKDIDVTLLCLAWAPYEQTETGEVIPLWRRSDPA